MLFECAYVCVGIVAPARCSAEGDGDRKGPGGTGATGVGGGNGRYAQGGDIVVPYDGTGLSGVKAIW
jgi:hypothetical protein